MLYQCRHESSFNSNKWSKLDAILGSQNLDLGPVSREFNTIFQRNLYLFLTFFFVVIFAAESRDTFDRNDCKSINEMACNKYLFWLQDAYARTHHVAFPSVRTTKKFRLVPPTVLWPLIVLTVPAQNHHITWRKTMRSHQKRLSSRVWSQSSLILPIPIQFAIMPQCN